MRKKSFAIITSLALSAALLLSGVHALDQAEEYQLTHTGGLYQETPAETTDQASDGEKEQLPAEEQQPEETPTPSAEETPTTSEMPEPSPNAEKKDDEEETEEKKQEVYVWTPPKQSTVDRTPLTWGDALAKVAKYEFSRFGWQASGRRYWTGHELHAWSADFVEWCAARLGLSGQNQLFGKTAYTPGELVKELTARKAQVYYPGDGTTPKPGDLAIWWCGGRPGVKSDGLHPEFAVHCSIVTAAEADTFTVVQGCYGSWAPTKAVLGQNTYKTSDPLTGNMYVMCFLRPNYDAIYSADRPKEIQKAICALLYRESGGYLACDFDGYTTLDGRHEGMDFCRMYGANLYAVTSGVITAITEGNAKEGDLSTLCVYDQELDRTVVYLHLTPAQELHAGQYISVGDYIGTEDYCGAQTPHTHVEVVNGYSWSASTSLEDPVLDNEDPYPYWAARLSRLKVAYQAW